MESELILRLAQSPHLRFVISKSVTLLGRSSLCDIPIDDLSVSRNHAEIYAEGNCIFVSDLGSKYGTFIDNERVKVGAAKKGQKLRFGHVTFDLCRQVDLDEDEETNITGTDFDGPLSAKSKGLTIAQKKVYELLLTGITEKAIATQMKLSENTIHSHVKQIYSHHGVHSRPELMAALLNLKKSE